MGNETHDFLPEMGDQEGPQPGPSWANPGWLAEAVDADADLTQALDPTQMKLAVAAAAKKAGKEMDAGAVEEAAGDSIRAMLLVRLYRVRGHMAANLDPLGLSKMRQPEDLSLEWHGFAGQEDKQVYVGGVFGFEWVTVRELYEALRLTYCGNVGLEYMHIADTEERRFLQDKFETPEDTIQFTPEGKKAILGAVIRGEQFEEFLGKKYVGTKRFGLDGGESMIPALEAVIKYGGADGVREIIYGMAHRGRLNVLANVMAKPYKVIFHEFQGGSANPDDVGGSGDVKYHLGTSTDREFDGIDVHMTLVPNPSHLEAVDPVVLGKARAQQAIRDDLAKHQQVLPVLIHGDAAFAGQGVVWESLSLSGVPGYDTGGCIHFIINNQIGFTTSPKFARSSPYPSDVAKGVQAPILHVNGDDPEAVTFACKLAIEYRQKFGRDIVIDMWCYRRFGHNEGDEPSFTQPLMYKEIRKHPKVSVLYSERLREEGVIEEGTADELRADFVKGLEEDFEAAKSYKPNEADWFGGRWAGMNKPADAETARRNADTAIEKKLFDSLGKTLTEVPDDLTIHKTLGRVLKAKKEWFDTGEGFDWATAEALAFGSLVTEGFGVRLSGQDSGRGTFSHRHAVWVDQTDERKYIPLTTLPHGKFEVYDSTLSEYGVLGLRIRFRHGGPEDAGIVGSAVRRFRQWRADHDRPVHRQRRGQMAPRKRSRDAVAAWVRRPGTGTQLRPARTVPATVRERQHPGLQYHHAGELLPRASPPDAAPVPQAADHHVAQVAAPPPDGEEPGRRFHGRQSLHADQVRHEGHRRRQGQAAGPVQRQGRLRPDRRSATTRVWMTSPSSGSSSSTPSPASLWLSVWSG